MKATISKDCVLKLMPENEMEVVLANVWLSYFSEVDEDQSKMVVVGEMKKVLGDVVPGGKWKETKKGGSK